MKSVNSQFTSGYETTLTMGTWELVKVGIIPCDSLPYKLYLTKNIRVKYMSINIM